MTTVAIQVAMKQEARFLIEALSLEEMKPLDEDMGFRLFEGQSGALKIFLALQGTDPRHGVEQVGLEAATLCTYLLLQKVRPDGVINFGTAGAFQSRGARIGDVFLVCPPVLFNDRRVPLPGYAESALGSHTCLASSDLAGKLGVSLGILSSGSSLEASPRDREVLAEQNADLVDMEGAAIAWVCERKKTPCLLLKSVTDLIDLPELPGVQFQANLQRASVNLRDAMLRLLPLMESELPRRAETV